MTRYDIAVKRPLIDFFLTKNVEVSRKTVVLKKWWPVLLEKSPCSATCHACGLNIPAKTIRFKVITVLNPWRKYLTTRLYHEHCLSNDLMKVIKKKEKTHGSDIDGRSVQKIRSG